MSLPANVVFARLAPTNDEPFSSEPLNIASVKSAPSKFDWASELKLKSDPTRFVSLKSLCFSSVDENFDVERRACLKVSLRVLPIERSPSGWFWTAGRT